MKSELEGFTCVMYARVSTDDKGQTVETQLRIMREWCERKGVVCLGEYTDEWTATELNRPGFMQAVGRVAVGDVNILLAYDQSRLTRTNDLKKIDAMITPFGCKVRFASQDMDPESLAAKMTNSVKGIMDEEENKERRMKTKLGLSTRYLEGKHIGRPAAIMFAEDVDCIRHGEYDKPEDGPGMGAKRNGRYVEGKTKVLPEDVLMNFAEQGYSIYGAAKIIGVTPQSLRRELEYYGRKEKYEQILNQAKEGNRKGTQPKGWEN